MQQQLMLQSRNLRELQRIGTIQVNQTCKEPGVLILALIAVRVDHVMVMAIIKSLSLQT
jgi:hypothetical protein